MMRFVLLSLSILVSLITASPTPFLSSLQFAPSDTLLLHPQFLPDIFAYQILIPEPLNKAFVKPTTNTTNSFVQVRVNDGPFIHGDNDQLSVSLIEGINHLIIQTGDEDTRVSIATYVITICNGPELCSLNRRPQEAAQLSHLSIKQVELYPAFNPRQQFYQARTSRHIHAAVVAASMRVPKDGVIAASMNGEVFDQLINGQFSDAMPMKVGRNYLFIQARDSHDSLVTYTILIDRGVTDNEVHDRTEEEKSGDIDLIGGMASIGANNPSTELSSLISSAGLFTPRFNPKVVSYSQTVDYHTQSFKVTAIPVDRHARMHMTFISSGRAVPRTLMLERATVSAPIALETGSNLITVWVTGSNFDSAPQPYEINVTRLFEGEEGPASNQHVHHRARPSTLDHRHVDPQLVSLRGEKYTIHVEEGEVYNLLSEPHLLMNGRWSSFVDDLSKDGYVLGISEIGIRTRSGHLVHVTSGAGSDTRYRGFARVTLNDSPLAIEDQAIIDNSDEEFHEEESSINRSINQSTDELYPLQQHRTAHVHTELLTFNQSNVFSIITSTWHISLTDSPRGIEPRVSLIGPLTVGAHGLIGQTYRAKRIGQMHQHGNVDQAITREEGSEDSMTLIEGDMLDFRIQDGDLFAAKFEFNLYEQE